MPAWVGFYYAIAGKELKAAVLYGVTRGTEVLFVCLQADHLSVNHRALYLRGDPYETSDAVFGVKDSLLIDLGTVTPEQAKQYGMKEGSRLISYDFVLVSKEESDRLREKNAMEAMQKLGRNMKMYNGLPVPDVD